MKNIQMIIAYKGTHYAGWQRQPNAPTVEEVLTGAIKAVTGETVTLYGSGRTDARTLCSRSQHQAARGHPCAVKL